MLQQAVRSHPSQALCRRLTLGYKLLVARIRLAHSPATPDPGFSVPGMVAQPCFMTKSLRIQEFSFFNASSLCSLSPSCWNLATQIGARTSSTAASAWTPACFSALPADIHPNPALSTIHHTTAPPATLHSTVFTVCHVIAHLFSARMLALITR